MNRPRDTPSGPAESASAAADRRLKRALLDASMLPRGAEVDALKAGVLAQWRSAHRAGVAAAGAAGDGLLPASDRAAARLSPALQRRRRRLWAGSAGLAATVALATAVITSRPDPVLEELMQPDVLSQLAIGEM